MRPFLKIALHLALASGIFIALALVPVARDAYRVLLRGMCNAAFSSVGDEGYVSFRLPMPTDVTPGNDSHELLVEIERRIVKYQTGYNAEGEEVRTPIVSGGKCKVVIPASRIGFMPTIELIALVIATPVPWVRRGLALMLGLIIVNAFVIARIWLMLIYFFSGAIDESLQQYFFSDWLNGVVDGLYEFFYVAPTATFVVPAIIWGALTLRPAELRFALLQDEEEMTEDDEA